MHLVSPLLAFRVTPSQEKIGLNISEHQAYTHSQLLLDEMEEHRKEGDFSNKVQEDPYTEVGQIAAQYNLVLE